MGGEKTEVCDRMKPMTGLEKMRKLELVVMVDMSASVSSDSVNQIWNWLKEVVAAFETEKSVKIALVHFGEKVDVAMGLNHYSTDKLVKSISVLEKRKKSYGMRASALNFALKTARKQLMTGDRERADRTILVISDGFSTEENTPFYHAELAAKEGIDVFAIGFGPVILKEYLFILCQGLQV